MAQAEAVQKKMGELIASIPASNRGKLDKEIDFENRKDIQGSTIPLHLGRIAAQMTNWEDKIADLLGLTDADRDDIMAKKPSLQRYDYKIEVNLAANI